MIGPRVVNRYQEDFFKREWCRKVEFRGSTEKDELNLALPPRQVQNRTLR